MSVIASLRSAFLLSAWTNIFLLSRNLSRRALLGHNVRSSGPSAVGSEVTACVPVADWLLSICSGIYQQSVTSSDLLLTAVLCVCVCDMALVEPVIVVLLELPRALPLSTHCKSDVLTNAHLQMHMPKYTNTHIRLMPHHTIEVYTRQPYNYTHYILQQQKHN